MQPGLAGGPIRHWVSSLWHLGLESWERDASTPVCLLVSTIRDVRTDLCPPPKSYVNILTSSTSGCCSLWTEGLSRGNQLARRRTLVPRDWCAHWKRRFGHRHRQTDTHTQGGPHVNRKTAVHKPRRGAWTRCSLQPSEGTSPADTVILDVQSPGLGTIGFCCFEPPTIPASLRTLFPPS